MRKRNSQPGDVAIGKRIKKAAVLVWDSVLWVIVLGVILAISGYSLYFVARVLGVPFVFAIGMSTVFDGSALIMAGLTLKYAEEGMAGGGPRMAVRVLALLSAYLQALHVILGGERLVAIPLWSSLPIIAMVVFEFQTRWIRRRALARAGFIYPAQLPSFGRLSWLFFPGETTKLLRGVLRGRTRALSAAFADRLGETITPAERTKQTSIKASAERPERPLPAAPRVPSPTPTSDQPSEPSFVPDAPVVPPADEVVPSGSGPVVPSGISPRRNEPGNEGRKDELSVRRTRHAPDRHKRVWLRAHGYPVGNQGALSQRYKDIYDEAHPEEMAEGEGG
jgi:hypothetical protein